MHPSVHHAPEPCYANDAPRAYDALMGRTPRTLTGTAVATPGDVTSQLDAIELATSRLHHAAEITGVHIGLPTMDTVRANGSAGGHTIIVMTAPVLATGSDQLGVDTGREHPAG